jgi:hypothetical protein
MNIYIIIPLSILPFVSTSSNSLSDRSWNAPKHYNYINTAASTFAGESILGSHKRLMTDYKIYSTPKIGLHFSFSCSYSFISSLPGGCKIDIHTLPS